LISRSFKLLFGESAAKSRLAQPRAHAYFSAVNFVRIFTVLSICMAKPLLWLAMKLYSAAITLILGIVVLGKPCPASGQ
jgi:hypothetical protein